MRSSDGPVICQSGPCLSHSTSQACRLDLSHGPSCGATSCATSALLPETGPGAVPLPLQHFRPASFNFNKPFQQHQGLFFLVDTCPTTQLQPPSKALPKLMPHHFVARSAAMVYIFVVLILASIISSVMAVSSFM